VGLNLEFIVEQDTNKLLLLHMDDILVSRTLTSVPIKMKDLFGKVYDWDYKAQQRTLSAKYSLQANSTDSRQSKSKTNSVDRFKNIPEHPSVKSIRSVKGKGNVNHG